VAQAGRLADGPWEHQGDGGRGGHTDLLSSREGQGTNKANVGLTGGFFDAAAGEMPLQGFTPDDIGKVGGGDFCRVFGRVTAARA